MNQDWRRPTSEGEETASWRHWIGGWRCEEEICALQATKETPSLFLTCQWINWKDWIVNCCALMEYFALLQIRCQCCIFFSIQLHVIFLESWNHVAFSVFFFLVKDLSPRLEFFLQETPKKPSQVSKKLAHPPPRRMLPLQSPELCQRDRPSPPRHPLCHRRPIHLSGFIPNSPVNIGSSATRPQPKPREGRGSVHHSVQPRGSSCLRLFPVSSANSDITANRSQLSPPNISNPASSQLIRDLSNHSVPIHIRSDELTKSQVTLFNSGSKNVMAQRQESNKVLFSLFF